LQRVEAIGFPKPADGCNRPPLGLSREHKTGIYRQAIEQDRTATAVPLFTSVFYFRKTQVPQCPQESEIRGELPLDLFSVYFEPQGNLFHRSS
jgi:hypothetical protein